MDAMDKAHSQDMQDQRRLDDVRLALVGLVKKRPSRMSASTVTACLTCAERLLEDSRRIDRVWD